MRPGAGAEGEQARRSSSRRRPANRATPGSTSYEGADQEPFEPGWTGATWYGASSGTYWTINPKEYADPRKHGPEYQARARRARDGSIPDETLEAGPPGPPDPGPADPEPGDDGPDRPSPGDEWADRPSPDADSTGDGADTSPPRPFAADWASRRPGGRRHWMDGRPPSGATASPGGAAAARRATATADPSAAAGASDPTSTSVDPNAPGMPSARPARGPGERGLAGPADPAGPAGPPGGGLRSWIEQPPADAPFRGPLLRRPTTSTGRLAMALLGWPPLGVFAAAAIDQSTGCGAFAASCPEVSSPGTWIVQAAIFLFLLALPAVAAWSAHGAIATLVVGVPTAVVLSAAGGTNVREASAPILLAVLAIAYLAGVAYAAVVGRRRAGPA